MKINHDALLSLIPTGLADSIDPCILTPSFLALLGRIGEEITEGVGPLSWTGDIADQEVSSYLDVMAEIAANAMSVDAALRELYDLNSHSLGIDFLAPISFHLISAQPLYLGKIVMLMLTKVYRALLGKVFGVLPQVPAASE
jgi:hypothetical protein